MVVDTVIVAGDGEDPFLARVVDIVAGNSGRDVVHLDVVGVPHQVIAELRHANLSPAGLIARSSGSTPGSGASGDQDGLAS